MLRPIKVRPSPAPRARHEVLNGGTQPYAPRMRDIETIDSELHLVAALRHAARERGGPLPSIAVADALLDQRSRLGTGFNLQTAFAPPTRRWYKGNY
jgi:hypothetical protein